MSKKTKKAIIYFPRGTRPEDISIAVCDSTERFERYGAVVVHDRDEVLQKRDADLLYLDPYDRNHRASWKRLALMASAAMANGFEIEIESI